MKKLPPSLSKDSRGKQSGSTFVGMSQRRGMTLGARGASSLAVVPRVGTRSATTRSILTSSSRRSLGAGPAEGRAGGAALGGLRPSMQVLDENGCDVTPRPLFTPEQGKASRGAGVGDAVGGPSGGGGSASDMLSSYSFYQTAVHTASMAGQFTRSTFGSSLSVSAHSSLDSLTDEIAEPSVQNDYSSLAEVQNREEEGPELLGEAELNRIVTLWLSETPTMEIMDMTSVSVSTQDSQAEAIRQRNQTYKHLCSSRMGNERYMERGAQTLNLQRKSKEVQCDRIVTTDAGIFASTWDMHDTFNELEASKAATGKAETPGQPGSSISLAASQHFAPGTDITASSMGTESKHSLSSSTAQGSESALGLAPLLAEPSGAPPSDAILGSPSFQRDLATMERVLVANLFQHQMAAYRQLPVLPDPDGVTEDEEGAPEEEKAMEEQERIARGNVGMEVGPKTLPGSSAQIPAVVHGGGVPFLQRLWAFSCGLTKGRNVSCLAWNRLNPDLLAVGYGEFGIRDQKEGLACGWSLKNPTWPDRVFHMESGVTCIDFSAANANLLAVGTLDGTVAVHNTREGAKELPSLTSSESGKHMGAVWQVQWVRFEQGRGGEDRGETLTSISADGRVTRWAVRKGLDCQDLMRLKRTGEGRTRRTAGVEGQRERKNEALIWRLACGTCVDFHPQDSNVYLAGTEEGFIHRCSCSYSEQHLQSYSAHQGPVYRVLWSPFEPEVFLSCSSDWSVRLWRVDLTSPVLTLQCGSQAVLDVAWSPHSPTLVAALTAEALHVWDLYSSTLEPVLVSPGRRGVHMTRVAFSRAPGHCLLVGDSDGHVTLYQLKGLLQTKKVALSDVISTILTSQSEQTAAMGETS